MLPQAMRACSYHEIHYLKGIVFPNHIIFTLRISYNSPVPRGRLMEGAMRNPPDNALYARIYEAAAQVPRGMVATYGDIATIVGGGCDARTVGYAMGDIPAEGTDVPWQRIVAKAGAISTRGLQQHDLLEAEGVAFDAQERVIMARHHWRGPGAEWAAAHGFHTLPPREDAEQLSFF